MPPRQLCRMNGKAISFTLLVAVLLLASVAIVLAVSKPTAPEAVDYPTPTEVLAATTTTPPKPAEIPDEKLAQGYTRLWMVGDVMLSRQVGQFARERGYDYPWRGVQGLFASSDAVLVNFEACVSATKTFAWEQSMRFPVEVALLPAAASSGVTHASLANNHALDCGAADYTFTQQVLGGLGITPLGHPVKITQLSVATTTVGTMKLGLIAIHTLFADPKTSDLEMQIGALASTTDFQIAFVHWGVEYESKARQPERVLAQRLAKLGIDLIVGHHPHVVQDIEWVGETLVLYSLGNFIFDQYFSDEVQQGLVVALEPDPYLHLRLVPVSSAAVRTQPQPLSGEEQGQFLRDLASRSEVSLREAILEGVIPLRTNLATSAKPGMIAP